MVLLYIYIVQQSQYIYYNNIQLLFCSTTLAAVLDQYVTASAAVVVVHHSVLTLSMMMYSTTAEAVILIIQLSPLLTLLYLQYHIIVLPYTLPYITYHNLYIISRLIRSQLPLLMLTELQDIILVAVMLLPLYPQVNNNTTSALQLLLL